MEFQQLPGRLSDRSNSTDFWRGENVMWFVAAGLTLLEMVGFLQQKCAYSDFVRKRIDFFGFVRTIILCSGGGHFSLLAFLNFASINPKHKHRFKSTAVPSIVKFDSIRGGHKSKPLFDVMLPYVVCPA